MGLGCTSNNGGVNILDHGVSRTECFQFDIEHEETVQLKVKVNVDPGVNRTRVNPSKLADTRGTRSGLWEPEVPGPKYSVSRQSSSKCARGSCINALDSRKQNLRKRWSS